MSRSFPPWRAMLALALLLGVGVVTVAVSQALSRHRQVAQYRAAAQTLGRDLDEAVLIGARRAARRLAVHPAVAATARGEASVDNPAVLEVLNTAKHLLQASIVYVLNSEGTTVACSPYGAGQTLTGNQYAFRPYFTEGMAHGQALYGALGVTTGRRGFYFAAGIPAGEEAKRVGVVVIKTGLETVDAVLARQATPCALLSRHGIVFASNQHGWLYRAAFPLAPDIREAIRTSRQFAGEPLEPLGVNALEDRSAYGEQDWLVFRQPLLQADWQVMVLRAERGVDLSIAATTLGISLLVAVLLFGVAHFYSQHRHSHQHLLEQRDRAQMYLDVAGVLFVALDRKGRVVLANPKCCNILEGTQEEILGRDWVDTFVPERQRAETRELFQRLMAGSLNLSEYAENGVIALNGEEKTIAWHYAVLRNAAGEVTGVLSSGEDVTEQRRLRHSLQQQEKMQSIGQLAGGVAHDFNNQLAVLLGYAELLRESLEEDDERCHYANTIIQVTERASELTRQLLAFARKGQYQALPVDIHGLVDEVVELLKRTIDKRILIETRLAADPPVVMGDPGQLQNALLNIAINARDAMPQGGTIRFETAVVELDPDYCSHQPYAIEPGFYLQICISDTGQGIPKENQQRIFEPFFTTKAKGDGTGMGLAAVYGTVKQHLGAINVYSEIGMGTCFKIYLPHRREKPAPSGQGAASTGLVRGHGTVLLVDDEDAVRQMGADILQHLGYRVECCANGSEALTAYRSRWTDIDLVILDMVMPVMGGADAFRGLREINPAAKVVLASGYSREGEAREVLEQGAAAFVQKPFRVSELSRTIAAVLADALGTRADEEA